MLVTRIRSVCRFKFASFPNFVRPISNSALAFLSDSSCDEQTPENRSNLDDFLVGNNNWDNQEYSFSRDTLKAHGFRHNLEAYVGIVRTLCEHGMVKKVESLLSQIMIEFGSNELIEALFQRLEDEGEEESSISVRVLGVLVKAYTGLGMYDEAIDVLFRTRRKGFIPCTFSINFLLIRLIRDSKVDMAVALYQQLKKFGFPPNVYTYNILIKAYCKKGCLEEVSKLFDEMEQAEVNPNKFTYTTYIEGCCLLKQTDVGYNLLKGLKVPLNMFAYAVIIRGFCGERDLLKAEEVLCYIESQGLIPDVRCFTPLIHAYYKCGDFNKVLNLHKSMLQKGIVYLLDKTSYNIIMAAWCKSGRVDKAEELVNLMQQQGMVPDIIHYSTLIHGYCFLGKLNDAERIFEEIEFKGLKPDIVTYNILVVAFCRHGLVEKASRIVNIMREHGLKPDDSMHRAIIEGLCISGKVKEAEVVFGRIETKSLDVYCAMICGYCEVNCISEAFEVFLMLYHQGIITLNKKCGFKLLNSLLNECEYDKAVFLFTKSIIETNPCLIMCSELIYSLCKAGLVTTARDVFDNWCRRGLETDAILYTVMIKGYCMAGCMLEAYDLFDNMKLRGINPDVITYTVLIDGRLKNGCFSGGQEVMNNVSYLWKEMKGANVRPDVVCYTVIIDKQCRLHNLKDAVMLYQEITKRGLQHDNVSYSIVLSAHYKRGFVDSAMTLIDSTSDNFFPRDDYSKLVEYKVKKAHAIRIKCGEC